MPYYAVAKGYNPGIFETWSECEREVKGYSGARFKKFKNRTEAEKFIQTDSIQNPARPRESYAGKHERFAESIRSSNIKNNSIPIKSETLDKTLFVEDTKGDEELLLALSALVEYPVASDTPTDKFAHRPSIGGKNRCCPASSVPLPVNTPPVRAIQILRVGRYTFHIDEASYVDAYIGAYYENIGIWNCSAGYGVCFGEDHPLNVAKPATGRITHNVGDIEAAIDAIEIALKVGVKKLCLHTDCEFLLSAVTTWIFAWKRNAWRNTNGKVVQNRKYFQKLDTLLSKDDIDVKWHNVKNGCLQSQSMIDEVKKLAKIGINEYLDLHPKKEMDDLGSSGIDFDFF